MTHISIDELEAFSKQSDAIAEDVLLKALPRNKQYKTALVVGRFQPLHRGHIHLIRAALRIASTVVICIGSANITDENNPFSVDTRIELLQKVLKRERLEKNIIKIFILNDTPDDNIWLHEALQKAGEIDVVVGNNDWVNGIFVQAGYPVIEIPLLKREKYEGNVIRKQLRAEGRLS